MIDIIDDLERWRVEGRTFAVARIVDMDGSGPRMAGATMAVNQEGEVVGSISGGCLESSVVEAALTLIDQRGEGRVMRFDAVSDPLDPMSVGLTCGGTVGVFIELFPCSLLPALVRAREELRSVALITVIEGVGVGASFVLGEDGQQVGSTGSPEFDAVLAAVAQESFATGENRLVQGTGGRAGFVHVFRAPAQMVIVGAVDFSAALVKVARIMGYRVTVCDARATFATPARFPEAHQVIVDWPHRFIESIGASLGPSDVVCVLTHDHKYDVPALLAALSTPVGYIGAMGSRHTHAERIERLIEAGADESTLVRVMAPIGLDIGASTPEEVAIATCAEIVASHHGRLGSPLRALRDGDGPIHRESDRTLHQ